MVLPWDTALEYIAEDGSDCWVRILIMVLETSLEEDKKLGYYQDILAALREHYQRTNDISNLEFLKAYE